MNAKKLALLCAIPIIGTGLIGCEKNNTSNSAVNTHSNINKHKKLPDQKAAAKTATNATQSSLTQEQPASTNHAPRENKAIVEKFIIGNSYTIFPIKFDGEDVGKAMDEHKAPVNTVHDNGTYLYFKTKSTIRVTGSMYTEKAWGDTYGISNDTLMIGNHFKIPYIINGDSVIFKTWDVKYDDGHTITYELKNDPSAKDVIDSKTDQE